MPDPVIPADRGADGTAGVTELVGDEVFSDAFDKAEEAGDKADLSVADDPQNLKEEDKKEPPIKTDAEIAAEAQAAKDAEEASKSTPVDDAAKMEQKYKTLQGIHRHDKETWEQERTRLQADLEEAKKPKTPKEETPKKEETAVSKEFEENLTDEQKAILAEYEKDFDLVSKYEGLKREKALKALEKRILKSFEDKSKELEERFLAKVAPLADTLRTTEEKEHFNLIKSAHPDFETYRDDGSILNWIGTKPKYMQDALKKTYSEGAAEDVVDLITDYKRENNLLPDETNNESSQPSNVVNIKRAEKKKALTAVVGKHGAINIAHATSTDYDSAFDEAINKK